MKRRAKKEAGAAPEETKEELHARAEGEESEEKKPEASAAAAEESSERRKGFRRVIPWGRRERGIEVRREEATPEVKERAQKGLSKLREHAPSGEEVRGWVEEHLVSQATAVGLGALAIGFGMAVLLPPTRAERKALGTALGAAQQLGASLDSARKALSDVGKGKGQEEETPPSPS